jgi:hypothetical protein
VPGPTLPRPVQHHRPLSTYTKHNALGSNNNLVGLCCASVFFFEKPARFLNLLKIFFPIGITGLKNFKKKTKKLMAILMLCKLSPLTGALQKFGTPLAPLPPQGSLIPGPTHLM